MKARPKELNVIVLESVKSRWIRRDLVIDKGEVGDELRGFYAGSRYQDKQAQRSNQGQIYRSRSEMRQGASIALAAFDIARVVTC